MTTSSPLTITAVAAMLGVSRQTTSKIVGRLGLGTRLGASPSAAVILTEADIPAIRQALAENLKKKSSGKLKPGNELWRLRTKKQKKTAKIQDR